MPENKADPTNEADIDGLLFLLRDRPRHSRHHAALTALVAERDKLVEDNASQTYKGNSVRYWHDKASARKALIDSLWEILESAAVRPDGERTITASLTALVAERDALLGRVAAQEQDIKALSAATAILRGKLTESPPAASDLRERLVCAIWPEILRQWREYKDAIDPRGCARSDALEEADKMLAAMRKGESDGK